MIITLSSRVGGEMGRSLFPLEPLVVPPEHNVSEVRRNACSRHVAVIVLFKGSGGCAHFTHKHFTNL